jgi:hypothetical protein
MIYNVTYDDIARYSKISITRKEYNTDNYKEIFVEKLKLCNWKNAGTRFNYNHYNFLCKIFEIEINKKEIILDKLIKISIKEQDYFYISFVTSLYNYKYKKDSYFKDNWFLSDGYLNTIYMEAETPIKTYCERNKLYRVDVFIKLFENYHIVIDYFEKHHHKVDDIDLRTEKTRFYHMMYDNTDESKKIVKCIVFWYTHLDDEKYTNKLIKKIYKLIQDYKNINDQREWCINVIDSEIIHSRELSEQLYDGYLDNNKPVITFSAINKLVEWKNENCKEECFAEFKTYIDELKAFRNNKIEDIDDFDFLNNKDETNIQQQVYYEENKLTYNGLFSFFPRIHEKYLINIEKKDKIDQLMKNITNGFISGIKERYEKLGKLSCDNIIGLNDM